MNIARIFGSAVIRKIAYILTGVALWALLSMLGIGNARAHTTNCSSVTPCERGAAWSGAALFANATAHCKALLSTSTGAVWRGTGAPITNSTSYQTDYFHCWNAAGTGYMAMDQRDTYYYAVCPASNPWDEVTKTCKLVCPNGYKEDPFNPGTCLDSEKCLARNAAFKPELTRQLSHSKSTNTSSFCDNSGCLLQRQYGGNTVCTGNDMCVTTGNWSYYGLSCSSLVGEPGFSPPPPQGITEPGNKPQECIPAGGNLSFCSKPNGQQCYSASTGKQICWASGETGTKTADDTSQKRDAGPNAIAPNLNLPNGDTLIHKPPSVTTNTTTNFNDSSTNRTTTTTTANYISLNGTNTAPNGGSGTGEPADGTGTGASGGTGTSPDGAPAGSTGGGTCDSAPATTGDPVGAMLATQLWKARCALEKNNPTNETGNIANCKTPWSVTGTDQQVNKARALRESLCPGMPADADFLGTGEGEATTGEVRENGANLLPGGLDKSGFGFGNTCPTIPTVSVMGQTIDFNTGPFCDWMRLGGWFVVLFAGLASLRLLTEA